MTLHMVEFWMKGKELIELSRALKLPRGCDDGYLVHCALNEALGGSAPAVFNVESGGDRQLRVLGYADVPAESLHEMSQGFASPLGYQLVDWSRTRSKPMPEVIPDGIRFNFELKTCPIVRLSKPKGGHKKGAEVDAFLSRCWDVGEDVKVDRSLVYMDWLRPRLGNAQKIKLLGLDVEGFQLAKLVRRTQGADRKAHTIKRPSVTFNGQLEVIGGEAFQQLLSRGIGRHRGFGFGMLKIRRAL